MNNPILVQPLQLIIAVYPREKEKNQIIKVMKKKKKTFFFFDNQVVFVLVA